MLFKLDRTIESCIFLSHVVELPRASRYPVMSLFGLVVAFTFYYFDVPFFEAAEFCLRIKAS
jgi:hypothetical protein